MIRSVTGWADRALNVTSWAIYGKVRTHDLCDLYTRPSSGSVRQKRKTRKKKKFQKTDGSLSNFMDSIKNATNLLPRLFSKYNRRYSHYNQTEVQIGIYIKGMKIKLGLKGVYGNW